MFQVRLNQIKNISESVKIYVTGLLTTIEKKTISSMVREMQISRHYFEQFFKNPENSVNEIQSHQISLIREFTSRGMKGQLNLDDVLLHKPHMYKNKVTTYDYAGSTKRIEKGFVLVCLSWTYKEIHIPFSFKFWQNKKDAGKCYIKKSDIAWKLIKWTKTMGIPFSSVALDGLYNSKEFIQHLEQIGINYIVRFHKNRKVLIDGKMIRIDQQPCFTFRRNQRFIKAYGSYKGNNVTFIAQKRKKKNKDKYEAVFFMTNISDRSAQETLDIYGQRWKIEKSFRRLKHKLGIQDCQMTSLEKQRAHIFAAFFVDAYISIIAALYKKKISPDSIVNSIRRQKIRNLGLENPFEIGTYA